MPLRSWANWADFLEPAGYMPLMPDGPDDPETVEEARANPDVLAKKTSKQIAVHTTEIIDALDTKPVGMGHSTGGVLAQMLAGRGLSAATVAIDPGSSRGATSARLRAQGRGPFLIDPLAHGAGIRADRRSLRRGHSTRPDQDAVASSGLLKDRASAQVQLGRAEAILRSGRLLLLESLSEAWRRCLDGETHSLEQKADLLLGMAHAMSSAVQAVELACSIAVTTALRATSPLERCFRDRPNDETSRVRL